jgi:hypothetical protein
MKNIENNKIEIVINFIKLTNFPINQPIFLNLIKSSKLLSSFHEKIS